MPPDDDIKQLPLNAGSRGMARDPAEIYEREESRRCVGCAYEITVYLVGASKIGCGRGKPYGRRCREYAERAPIQPVGS